MFAFSLVWTAVASAAITTIVIRRRYVTAAPIGARVGGLAGVAESWPVPAWVPPSDELLRAPPTPQTPVPLPLAAHAVTLRLVVPSDDGFDSWERDETVPRLPAGSTRMPTAQAV
ncbi:MAG: hypothetical protein KIT31_11570 [Deltaproteobacteria bacterium]|nr:hypothetical protein [Deltaproteobacteria bacterium]